ncbi:MAG: BamA/TamA family outer membrane protein [Bacteroidota bacterium]
MLASLLSIVKGSAQTTDSSKQTNWVSRTYQKIMKDTLPPERARFLVYPTLAYSPETSLEIGFAAVRLFYVNQDIVNNRLSEIYAFAFGTLRRQYGMEFEHSIYGDHDSWFFLGRGKFQRFPLLYYGIGPETVGDHPFLIDGTYVQLRERVLRKIVPNLFIGPEIDLQLLHNPRFEPDLSPLPLGGEGSRTFGLGVGLVYDNRHNVMNVRKGLFGELAVLDYRPAWGSDWKFSSLNLDVRYFVPLKADKSQVLGFQGFGKFVSGEVPFNQLALMGGPFLMRGYYLGRFRDRNYLAVQAEYRMLPFPFSKRIGATVFASGGMVGPTVGELRISQLKPAAGVGFRYLIFPKKDIFVRFDFAFTQEGPGFYIYTGEAF